MLDDTRDGTVGDRLNRCRRTYADAVAPLGLSPTIRMSRVPINVEAVVHRLEATNSIRCVGVSADHVVLRFGQVQPAAEIRFPAPWQENRIPTGLMRGIVADRAGD